MTNNKKGAKRHLFMWHYKTLCITNVYIYLAIFRYWNIQRFQMQKNKKTPQNQGVAAEFRGSGNWTRTSDIRINSPLFYRLNYARITGRMIYLNCVQVKEFVNGGKENLSGPEKRLLGVGKYKFVPGLTQDQKRLGIFSSLLCLGWNANPFNYLGK